MTTVLEHPLPPPEPPPDSLPSPSTLRLPYTPASARAARDMVRAKLTEWDLPHLIDDAELITSELVGNAAKTGCQTSMLVGIRHSTSSTVRLLVSDGSASLPVLIDAGPGAESGRGLALVDQLTRQRWGVTVWPHGKVVHADLAVSPPTSVSARKDPARTAR